MAKNFQVMMKDPDGVYESFKSAVDDGLLTQDEADAIRDKYFEYDEYCHITFNIDGDVITPRINTTDVAF